MDKNNEQLEALAEIRSMMDRSSRFISLSGLSGVIAGIFALMGAGAVYWKANMDYDLVRYYNDSSGVLSSPDDFTLFMIFDAACVLIASLLFGYILTARKAKSNKQTFNDPSARRLAVNLFLPLLAGGIFCIILMWHGLIGLVAPATLLFYGLALLNGSKYTLDDIRYLGILEIILGLISAYYIGYGLVFWALGFGVLHIVYGIRMWYKYDR